MDERIEPGITKDAWTALFYRDFIQVCDGSGNEICYIDEIYDRDVAEANARLIEAAPKLYDAMKNGAQEQCYNCPLWDAEKERCGEKDVDCFVREWWSVLDEVKGRK